MAGIIISHNHPSGNLKPSRQDEELTQKIKRGGQLLDIKLLDHAINCTGGFYSFADEGMLKAPFFIHVKLKNQLIIHLNQGMYFNRQKSKDA